MLSNLKNFEYKRTEPTQDYKALIDSKFAAQEDATAEVVHVVNEAE